MESLLKEDKVRIESLDRELTIRELSAKAQLEVLQALRSENNLNALFVVCRHGVPEWADETPESLSEKLTLTAAREVSDAVSLLSGIDEAKNSASAPSGDSSTASQLN